MSQVSIWESQTQTQVVCPGCRRSFTHKEYVDHLFHEKECMRAYWQEEERMHAYNVRHRSLNRKRERELAKAREEATRQLN
jgi:hypothetical protein